VEDNPSAIVEERRTITWEIDEFNETNQKGIRIEKEKSEEEKVMAQSVRMERDREWKRRHTRIGYALLAVVILAFALMFFGRATWITVPLGLVGVALLVSDVAKYRMRRSFLFESAAQKMLRWQLGYDIVNTSVLIIMVGGLLIFSQDNIYWAFAVVIWGIIAEVVSRRLNRALQAHDPILRALELEEAR
jgi:cation transport ATPase